MSQRTGGFTREDLRDVAQGAVRAAERRARKEKYFVQVSLWLVSPDRCKVSNCVIRIGYYVIHRVRALLIHLI